MAERRRAGKSAGSGFLRDHSLLIAVSGVWLFWLVTYQRADPDTHLGAFLGNSIADWLGTLSFIILTKYCFEIGSKESRRPNPSGLHGHARRFLYEHSMTLVVIATGAFWVWLYAHTDANSKGGQVYGNIVSEWGQLLALIVMTKYFRERGSKED